MPFSTAGLSHESFAVLNRFLKSNRLMPRIGAHLLVNLGPLQGLSVGPFLARINMNHFTVSHYRDFVIVGDSSFAGYLA
jgi:hypothetical protein